MGAEPVETAARAFRNIRYATAERFRASQLLDFDSGTLNDERGPIAAQLPSRLELVNGPQAPLAQDEHPQVLSVFVPQGEGPFPVVVWLHGGANLTGGGELPWYDGSRFAAEQNVIVVSVSARLGVLGYLHLDDLEGPTPAMTDQLNALEWVHRNIAGFGGDPMQVTLMGQSAGASTIEALLRWPHAPGVRAAIMLSGYFVDGQNYWRADAEARSRQFVDFLGDDPRTLDVASLLEAQAHFTKVSPQMWAPIRPEHELDINVPIITGWNRDDALPFYMLAHGIADPRVARNKHAEAAAELNEVRAVQPTYDLAREVVEHGQDVWLYEFAWESEASGWGAPHCVELPYLFGDEEAWKDAPVIAGLSTETLYSRGRIMRDAWGRFARELNPGADWQKCSRDSVRVGYVFGDDVSTEGM